jgi:hypothetical protein
LPEPGSFDVERALAHVRALTRHPGQTGSPGNAERRRYIEQRLRELGLEQQNQTSDAVVSMFGRVVGARVDNVVARLRGSEGGPAVLLSAHYDAVPNSPGAADDAAGIATLLETARVLRAARMPRHDVVFLFADGEELGLLGADAFATEHAWRKDVAVVLNFEARGSHGASAMYETSRPNAGLVSEFARAAEHPVGNSLLSSLSRALPNDSDFTIYKRNGMRGFAFAFADGISDYHRATDSVEHLDPRSLAHHLSYATALATSLANTEAWPRASGNRVYFELFARSVVSYPVWLAQAGALLLGGLLGCVLVHERRAGRLRASAVGAGALASLGAVVSTVVVSVLVDALLGGIVPRDRRVAWATAWLPVHVSLGLAACLLLYARLLEKRSARELYFGSLVAGALVALVLAFVEPGMSYAPEWLTAFALAGEWLSLRSTRGREPALPRPVWSGLFLVPAAFFVASIGYALFVLVGTQLPAATAVATGWGAALFLPFGAHDWRPRLRSLSLGALGLAAVLTVGVYGWQRAAPPPPLFGDLSYAVDADGAHASWLWQGMPLAPTSSASLPPVPPMSGPTVRPLADRRAGGHRKLELEVSSNSGARCVELLELAGTRVYSTRVNGKPPHPNVRFGPELDRMLFGLVTGAKLPNEWNLEFCGSGGAPLRIELDMADAPLELQAVDVWDGLPPGAEDVRARLPPFEFDARGNRTLVSRSYAL